MPKLLLDMDGVLVDFVRGAFKEHGKEIPYGEMVWDFDQIFFPGQPELFWEPMGFQFWSELPWMPNGKELFVALAKTYGYENITLTTSPSRTVGSIEGKIQWIRNHLPPEMHRRFNVTPVKEECASPNRILLDDSGPNCEKFLAEGGKVVLIPQPWNAKKNELDRSYNFDVQAVLAEVAKQWR